jgi:hypothetical protein
MWFCCMCIIIFSSTYSYGSVLLKLTSDFHGDLTSVKALTVSSMKYN